MASKSSRITYPDDLICNMKLSAKQKLNILRTRESAKARFQETIDKIQTSTKEASNG